MSRSYTVKECCGYASKVLTTSIKNAVLQ